MEPWVKYILVAVLLVIAALCLPALVALAGVALSPVIGAAGFVAILFFATVIIAYKNKIGRK